MVAAVARALTDLLMAWAKADDVDPELLRLPFPKECDEDFGYLTSRTVAANFGIPPDIMRAGSDNKSVWSAEEQKAVGAYLRHLYELYCANEHVAYTAAFDHPERTPQAMGAGAWKSFIIDAWKAGQGRHKLKAVLTAHGLDLETLVMLHAELPEVVGLGWQSHSQEIALSVFGNDALPSPNAPVVRPAVLAFVNTQFSRLRQDWRPLHAKRRKTLNTKMADLKTSMKAAADSPETFSRPALLELLKNVHGVHETAMRGGFTKDTAMIAKWRTNFKEIAAFFLAGPEGQGFRIPAQLSAALKHLMSSETDRAALARVMENAIAEHDAITMSFSGDDGAVAAEGGADARGPLADIAHWVSGLGEASLDEISIDMLYKDYLGISDGRIPGLHEDMLVGAEACMDRWEAGEEALHTAELAGLKLSRRQIVGIVQMLINAFQGIPIMNNDDVGVGKTFQVLGFIAVLAWFHEYRKKTGDKKWPIDRDLSDIIPCPADASKSHNGNIPGRSCIITVPVPLLSMWMDEAHKLLKKSHFAVIPYETQSREVSAATWNQIYANAVKKCNDNHLKVIVIATTKAMHTDFTQSYFKPSHHNGRYVARGTVRLQDTVFGRLYTASFYDEAHLSRHGNGFSFHMHHALSYLSGFPCALTATPVMTTPGDAGELARMVLVPEFEGTRGDTLLAQLKKEERLARKAVADTTKGQGEEPVLWKEALRRNGLATGDELSSESRNLIRILETQCGVLRAMLHRYIIRRENVYDPATMAESERHRFPPKPIVTDILVDMFPEELREINAAYTTAAAQGHRAVKAKPSSGFYTCLRQQLTHYKMRSDAEFPKSIKDWNAAPGAKLNAVVDILLHHLASDHAPPLMTDPASSSAPARAPTEPLLPNPGHPGYQADKDVEGSSDKIVVFSRWVNLYPLILRRFKLAGIEVLSLTGKESTAEKKRILQEFYSSKRIRVLLVSTVALNGLNLQHACILIVLDVLWSAQEVTQLLGRLVRQGQQKVVIAYHIIANGTTDIALNNISFDKKSMHQGYFRIPAALQKILTDTSDDEESIGESAKAGQRQARKAKRGGGQIKTLSGPVKSVGSTSQPTTVTNSRAGSGPFPVSPQLSAVSSQSINLAVVKTSERDASAKSLASLAVPSAPSPPTDSVSRSKVPRLPESSTFAAGTSRKGSAEKSSSGRVPLVPQARALDVRSLMPSDPNAPASTSSETGTVTKKRIPLTLQVPTRTATSGSSTSVTSNVPRLSSIPSPDSSPMSPLTPDPDSPAFEPLQPTASDAIIVDGDGDAQIPDLESIPPSSASEDYSGMEEGYADAQISDLESIPPSPASEDYSGSEPANDMDVVTSPKPMVNRAFPPETPRLSSSGNEESKQQASSHPSRLLSRAGLRQMAERQVSVGISLAQTHLSSDDDSSSKPTYRTTTAMSTGRSRSGTLKPTAGQRPRIPPMAMTPSSDEYPESSMSTWSAHQANQSAPSMSGPRSPDIPKGKRVDRSGPSRLPGMTTPGRSSSRSSPVSQSEPPGDHGFADTEEGSSTGETSAKRTRSGSDVVPVLKKTRRTLGRDTARAEAQINPPSFTNRSTLPARPRRPDLSWKAATAATVTAQPTPRLPTRHDAKKAVSGPSKSTQNLDS